MKNLPLILTSACLMLTACETSVAPRSGADRHFSLYGVLNPTADSQGVVVFPIEDDLRQLPNEPLPVLVTSTDLVTGAELVWQDSVQSREDGAVHIFWTPLRPAYDRTYRVAVQSLEGSERAETTVHVPPEAEIEPRDPVQGIWITQDLEVTAPVGRINFLVVRYVIKARLPAINLPFPELLADQLPPFGTPPPTEPDEPAPADTLTEQTLFVPIEYADNATRDARGWTIPLNLSEDFREIRRRVSTRGRKDETYGIRLERIEVSLVAANPEWAAPGDRYDAEILIQPGTMSNVTGGFGFVGAGYRLIHHYTLPDDILVAIGFRLASP